MTTTLTRGDGETMRLNRTPWQHDPYTAYIAVGAKQLAKAEAFAAASEPVRERDGNFYPTSHSPLRFGAYGAVAHLILSDTKDRCPHCERRSHPNAS